MKVACLQEQLNQGLKVVKGAVARRTTLPITSNVLLATDQARLKLVATNLEMIVREAKKGSPEAKSADTSRLD